MPKSPAHVMNNYEKLRHANLGRPIPARSALALPVCP